MHLARASNPLVHVTSAAQAQTSAGRGQLQRLLQRWQRRSKERGQVDRGDQRTLLQRQTLRQQQSSRQERALSTHQQQQG